MEASLTLRRKRWSHLCVCVSFSPVQAKQLLPAVPGRRECHRPWCVTGPGVSPAGGTVAVSQERPLFPELPRAPSCAPGGRGARKRGKGRIFPGNFSVRQIPSPGPACSGRFRQTLQPRVSPGLGGRLADRTVLREPAGKVQRVFSHFFPLPLPLPRQQTSGSFLRN